MGLLFAWFSFKFSGDKNIDDSIFVSEAAVNVPHSISSINSTMTLVLQYGVAAVVITDYLATTGLISLSTYYNGGFIIEANFLEAQLVNFGIIIAVLKSKLVSDEKYPVAVGLFSEQISELFLSTFMAMLMPLAIVAITVYLMGLIKKEKGIGLSIVSIKKALLFNIGVTLGRIIGSVAGAVLLGSSGVIIGAALSEQLLGVFAISSLSTNNQTKVSKVENMASEENY